jgi:glycerophosphoryl diester phosphodiesterase
MTKTIAKILIMFGLALPACTMTNGTENLILAHRGVPFFAPEETLPSYLLARDLGAHYLEADLQRSSDGVIFALHDDDLRRTTNINEIFPERAESAANTFTWQELQKLDAGSWFNKAYPDRARKSYAGLKLLSLDDLINIAEGGPNPVGIYLETKHPENFPGIEQQLKEQLIQRGWYQKNLSNGLPCTILQSFSPESIILLKENFPETPITFLLWQGKKANTAISQEYLDKVLDFTRKTDINIVGPSFSGEETNYSNFLTSAIIDQFNEENLEIHAYTFDTEQDILQYAPLVKGQFTNRTDLQLDYYGIKHESVDEILSRHKFN